MDLDCVFFVGVFVFGGDVYNVVGVDVESDFDLWNFLWCWWDVG